MLEIGITALYFIKMFEKYFCCNVKVVIMSSFEMISFNSSFNELADHSNGVVE